MGAAVLGKHRRWDIEVNDDWADTRTGARRLSELAGQKLTTVTNPE
jgi:hypothetical protein